MSSGIRWIPLLTSGEVVSSVGCESVFALAELPSRLRRRLRIPGTATAPGLEARPLLSCEDKDAWPGAPSLMLLVELNWGSAGCSAATAAAKVGANVASIFFAFFISGDSANETASIADTAKT